MKDMDKRISIIAEACNNKKAFDIKVLDLRGLTPISDYFIIASGNSTTQTMAIADEIEEKMSAIGFETAGKEGYKSGRWILIDYGDIVVHIFHKDDRDFYNLEKLWSNGEEYLLDHIYN